MEEDSLEAVLLHLTSFQDITESAHKYNEATEPYGEYLFLYRSNFSFGSSLRLYKFIIPLQIARSLDYAHTCHSTIIQYSK